jgi:UDP-2,4-diacetamido-2,4,6-trideoxy-beta-L-altropyranose hydrolase
LKKSKVFLRVDGNAQIGLGHLVRCIALAQMLKDDFEIFFACSAIPENINEVKKLGFNLLIIKSEEDFLLLLKNDVIVVLDHYGLDSNYQKAIKDKGCKLVCIDDLHDKEFFADLIINHAPNMVPSDYQAQIYTRYALGLDFVLLRPVFLNKAKQTIVNKAIQTAFVCFGGADTKNITQTAVNILKADLRFKKVIVVTGAAYNYLNELKGSVANNTKVSLYHAIDPETMSNLIAEADLAIVPASGILQEVLAVGCKVISGMYIENQKNIFNSYKALGAFESAENFSDADLLHAIDVSLKSEDVPNKKFIDGKSGKRLLKCFKQLQLEEGVWLRNANESDLLKTFQWAGNAELRKFSFNTRLVKFEEHRNWFINKLNNNNCFYYLGILNDEIFGSIRFDIEDNKAKISYLVDPLHQNNGLGTILLKKGLNLFTAQSGGKIAHIYGEVFSENLASIKAFQKLGYIVEVDSSVNIVKFKKELPDVTKC